MLAVPATQEEKGGRRGAAAAQPSVIHIRQREGEQSWLSLKQWELSPSFGDCRVFPIRALVPEVVTKELGAFWLVLFCFGVFFWGGGSALALPCFVCAVFKCRYVRASPTVTNPQHSKRPPTGPDFLALWEGCFFSEPPSAEVVDVHRFAAFFDLPMEMIRFFFCEGPSSVSVACIDVYTHARARVYNTSILNRPTSTMHRHPTKQSPTAAKRPNPHPQTTHQPAVSYLLSSHRSLHIYTPSEYSCDKAEGLVARADYVRFMRWAIHYLKVGPFEFKSGPFEFKRKV